MRLWCLPQRITVYRKPEWKLRWNLAINISNYLILRPIRRPTVSYILSSFKLALNCFIFIRAWTENLALGKPADQSSLFGIGRLEGVASKAVDGNADPNYDHGYCSHTHSDNPSWWRVDLGSNDVPVSEVYIVNRFTTDPNLQLRSKDYKITLGKRF